MNGFCIFFFALQDVNSDIAYIASQGICFFFLYVHSSTLSRTAMNILLLQFRQNIALS